MNTVSRPQKNYRTSLIYRSLNYTPSKTKKNKKPKKKICSPEGSWAKSFFIVFLSNLKRPPETTAKLNKPQVCHEFGNNQQLWKSQKFRKNCWESDPSRMWKPFDWSHSDSKCRIKIMPNKVQVHKRTWVGFWKVIHQAIYLSEI